MTLPRLPLLVLALGLLLDQEPDVRVRPGSGAGPVTATSTYKALRKRLGPQGIDTARVDIGEGFSEPGAVLYPLDPFRMATIYWDDTIHLERPRGLLIAEPNTRWELPLGITIGTTLVELEKLNGGPFLSSGYDWDYGGRSRDWQGGASTLYSAPQ